MTEATTSDRIAIAAAAVLHLGIAVFPLSASGLIAPLWFIVLTGLAWTAAAVAIWRLSTTAPKWAPTVPFALLGAWGLGIVAGERLLGWTA